MDSLLALHVTPNLLEIWIASTPAWLSDQVTMLGIAFTEIAIPLRICKT
jgi:hypothetical protein